MAIGVLILLGVAKAAAIATIAVVANQKKTAKIQAKKQEPSSSNDVEK